MYSFGDIAGGQYCPVGHTTLVYNRTILSCRSYDTIIYIPILDVIIVSYDRQDNIVLLSPSVVWPKGQYCPQAISPKLYTEGSRYYYSKIYTCNCYPWLFSLSYVVKQKQSSKWNFEDLFCLLWNWKTDQNLLHIFHLFEKFVQLACIVGQAK